MAATIAADVSRSCCSLLPLIRLHRSIHSKHVGYRQGCYWTPSSATSFNAAIAASFNRPRVAITGTRYYGVLCAPRTQPGGAAALKSWIPTTPARGGSPLLIIRRRQQAL